MWIQLLFSCIDQWWYLSSDVCQMSIQFVESMLDIHAKYSELVQSVFNADQQFYGALDKVASSLCHVHLTFCLSCHKETY